MNTHPNIFKRHHETVKDRSKRLLFSLLWYGPFLGFILSGSWYIKKMLPTYIANYFGLPAAQSLSALSLKRAEFLKDNLSFPMGLPQYLTAQASAIATTTKAGTLEITTNATISLLNGLLFLICIVAVIFVILRFIKHYKMRSSEERIARLTANRLIPMLEEINNNIVAIQEQARRNSPNYSKKIIKKDSDAS